MTDMTLPTTWIEFKSRVFSPPLSSFFPESFNSLSVCANADDILMVFYELSCYYSNKIIITLGEISNDGSVTSNSAIYSCEKSSVHYHSTYLLRFKEKNVLNPKTVSFLLLTPWKMMMVTSSSSWLEPPWPSLPGSVNTSEVLCFGHKMMTTIPTL